MGKTRNIRMGNCTTAPINNNNNNNKEHHLLAKIDDTWLEGEWVSTKDCCGFGYRGVWDITVNGDELILQEQHGACCAWVPNPCLKRGRALMHRMVKVGQNEWRGTLGCKPISLTVVSERQLSHLTTDGYFTLSRAITTTPPNMLTEKHATTVDIKAESGALLPPPYMPHVDVEGVWKVKRNIDVAGHYEAEGEILADGDEITITQQRGTRCWKLLPDSVVNRCGRPCHMKGSRQTLVKVAPGRWEGSFLCQTLALTVVSENELRHSLGFPEGTYTLTRN